MTLEVLLPFLTIVAFSSYFQTVTGFGLGIIIMGLASGMDLLPVATIAATNSLLTLGNGAFALPGAMRHIEWRATRAALWGMVPAMIGGVYLLDYLSSSTALLKFLLGLAIAYSGTSIAVQATPAAKGDNSRGFFFSGIFSGAMAGLFGLAGPPLVYQFYRHALSLQAIRYSLIFLFTVSACWRTAVIAVQGQLNHQIILLGLLSLPVGALATLAGKRYPPPFGRVVVGRIASLLLVIIGVSLIWPALRMWLGHPG